eukprot:g401.t1
MDVDGDGVVEYHEFRSFILSRETPFAVRWQILRPSAHATLAAKLYVPKPSSLEELTYSGSSARHSADGLVPVNRDAAASEEDHSKETKPRRLSTSQMMAHWEDKVREGSPSKEDMGHEGSPSTAKDELLGGEVFDSDDSDDGGDAMIPLDYSDRLVFDSDSDESDKEDTEQEPEALFDSDEDNDLG